MTTAKPLYGAATTITITAASLANGTYQQSASVDNSANLYTNAKITGHVKTGASGVTGPNIQLFAYYSIDGGGTYTLGASGSNATYTPFNAAALVPVCVEPTTTNGQTVYYDFDFCGATGLLLLPKTWGIILFNNTGAALDATGGNFLFQYAGENIQSV